MRDLPDFLLSDENNQPSPPAPKENDSVRQGFLLVFLFHLISFLIALLIAAKTIILFTFFYLPFLQCIYAIPIMIILSNRGKKKMVKGALFATLLTAAPLALMMLLAIAGFALCAVILAGAGTLSHH